jgi:hypothetical protein
MLSISQMSDLAKLPRYADRSNSRLREPSHEVGVQPLYSQATSHIQVVRGSFEQSFDLLKYRAFTGSCGCDTSLSAILRHFLHQRLTLCVSSLHDFVHAIDRLAILKRLSHLSKHSLKLVREPLMYN